MSKEKFITLRSTVIPIPVENIDTDNTDKKSKGKFRGLFRKAARFIDRTTNADTDGNQSIVRVASFEIAKK